MRKLKSFFPREIILSDSEPCILALSFAVGWDSKGNGQDFAGGGQRDESRYAFPSLGEAELLSQHGGGWCGWRGDGSNWASGVDLHGYEPAGDAWMGSDEGVEGGCQHSRDTSAWFDRSCHARRPGEMLGGRMRRIRHEAD
jgi:hypothetical protein